MIIVVAALGFDNQADRDHAVELTREVQLATRNEEAGCHDYCFASDPSVPTRIQVYELWENSAALAETRTTRISRPGVVRAPSAVENGPRDQR